MGQPEGAWGLPFSARERPGLLADVSDVPVGAGAGGPGGVTSLRSVGADLALGVLIGDRLPGAWSSSDAPGAGFETLQGAHKGCSTVGNTRSTLADTSTDRGRVPVENHA